MTKPILSLMLILALVPAVLAQDVTFNKTRYSSVKQPKEVDIILTITDSKILIKSKGSDNKVAGVDAEIPFSAIDSMSYELASRHRTGEGAALMGASLGAGAILMATKTKSYWLDIEYHEADTTQLTILRLDKSEQQKIVETLQAKTGKQVTALDAKASPLNPTVESKDIDEVVPFGKDAVAGALKPAMESVGCEVTNTTANQVECKRKRGHSERNGAGGEKVTATLEAQGGQTRVRIETGKGFVGRLAKKNWSTPVYQEMVKNLQKPAQSATASSAK